MKSSLVVMITYAFICPRTPNASGTHICLLVNCHPAVFRGDYWKATRSSDAVEEKLSITTVICFFPKLEQQGKKGKRLKHVLPENVQQLPHRRQGLIFVNDE